MTRAVGETAADSETREEHHACTMAWWGPPTWTAMHAIAHNFPDAPTEAESRAAAEFFNSLKLLLPCRKWCRPHYCAELAKDPVELHVHSKAALTRWLWSLHNRVNERLGKPQLAFEDAVRLYETDRKAGDVCPVSAVAQESATCDGVIQPEVQTCDAPPQSNNNSSSPDLGPSLGPDLGSSASSVVRLGDDSSSSSRPCLIVNVDEVDTYTNGSSETDEAYEKRVRARRSRNLWFMFVLLIAFVTSLALFYAAQQTSHQIQTQEGLVAGAVVAATVFVGLSLGMSIASVRDETPLERHRRPYCGGGGGGGGQQCRMAATSTSK